MPNFFFLSLSFDYQETVAPSGFFTCFTSIQIIMLKKSSIQLLKQIRYHSSSTTARAKVVFPQVSEITALDIGSSSKLDQKFGKGSYHLQRTAQGNLPIYIEYKDNNNVHTEIRKISGDVVLLRNDLVQILDYIPKKNFKVMSESNKLLIKGHYKNELVSLFQNVF